MAKKTTSSKPQRRKGTQAARKRKPSFSNRIKIYLLGSAVAILVLTILLGLSGWIGYEMGKEKQARECEKRVTDYRKDIRNLRRRLSHAQTGPAPVHHKPAPAPKPSKPKAEEEKLSEISDYLEAGGEKKAKPPVREKVSTRHPVLAIVIDDVAFASQARAIKALPWHITPSIFPPSGRHPDTPKIASGFSHYMIHLPMEALHYPHPEPKTLTVDSTAAEMEARLRHLRQWFPKARFINNHTGSRFTSDMAAMRRFYPLAKRYGFIFIDSRTTPKTVVPAVCKKFGDPYVARDIFLDNKPDTAYIQEQLKKAVRLAKAHGYAIAIGHPHPSTLKALAASGAILKGVNLVYIDQLYAKIR
ncbi:divergent polysaccharide deacetylase family protein [Hydrogenimonas sp. SS33]|uniref:divergent polysaccharide deacetylase family protein n=1 Tax=Hydrogenimonas leucolamina TaxID=2954236 RepID=UPI00336BB841